MSAKKITVSGIIGAGKTTLVKYLAKELSTDEHTYIAYYESVKSNPYLSDFYKDMSLQAFKMQIFLLSDRFGKQQQINWSNDGAIMDRCVLEDRIFAEMLNKSGLMDDRDYKTYVNLFDNMMKFLGSLHLIVHLDVTPSVALERVKQRGRESEKNLTIEYQTDLSNGYEEWLTKIECSVPVLRIDWNEFKPLSEVADLIREKLKIN